MQHYINDSANAAYLRECRAMESDCEGEWLIAETVYDVDLDDETQPLLRTA